MPDTASSGLRATVESVEDPLLGRTLGELGLVESVAERRIGPGTVKIRIPVPNHPSLRDLDAALK
ncbi:MAG: hypothetical protein ACLFWM_13350, partial [Actinomycetota bacterium]